MHKLRWIVPLLFLLVANSVGTLANDSPIDESAVVKTGNLTLLEPKEIIVDQEMLHLTLDGDFTHVYAYYEIINPGAEDQITLGIPVDYLKDSEIYGIAWQQESFFSYQINDEQGRLDVQEYTDEKPGLVILDGRQREVVRKWYVTEVQFPANGRKQLIINYTVRNSLLDKDSIASFFPRYSDRLFNYCFLPVGGWENDLIRNFKIVLDARENIKNGAVIKSLGFQGFYGYGGLFVFETKDFNLQDLPELKILYDNSASLLTEFVTVYQVKKENVISLRSSSTLAGYPPTKLIDADCSTAWVGGSKVEDGGEWIEVKLKDFCLQAVGIINGLPSDADTYYAFNRVKRLKIEIEQDEYDFFTDQTERKHLERVVELEDKPFSSINQLVFAPFVSILADLGQSLNQTYRVRLTILEVYPGTKHRNCISELFLLGYRNAQAFGHNW